MTFNSDDFIEVTQPRQTDIANANGVTYPVTGAGIVALSPSLSLSNTLLVPFLSNKLTFVGQVTEELNCVALMYPIFVLFRIFSPRRSLGVVLRRGGGGVVILHG